jgi:hypothetical protein
VRAPPPLPPPRPSGLAEYAPRLMAGWPTDLAWLAGVLVGHRPWARAIIPRSLFVCVEFVVYGESLDMH